jgi:hypothetical protein
MNKKLSISFLIIIFLSNFLIASVYYNRTPPTSEEKSRESYYSYINQGAAFYFEALSEINKFFSDVEIEGLREENHLANAKRLLQQSIEQLNIAIDTLILTDFQKQKYSTFDYSLFLKDPLFHKATMEIVVKFFKKADITGFFSENILLLNKMIQAIDTLEISETKENLWALYILSTNRLGHYGTIVSDRVFK